MSRDYLLCTSAKHGVFVGGFVGENRLFDVAVNDYTGQFWFDENSKKAEYRTAIKKHKWPTLGQFFNAPDGWYKKYKFFAFIDDDIALTTEEINKLFQLGELLNLNLYQPSLAHHSSYSHEVVRHKPDSLVRKTHFVEIMMPFFSLATLEKCLPSFTMYELGWGLEFLWHKWTAGERMAIVDAIQAVHTRPITSGDWKNSRGESAADEMNRLFRENGLIGIY